MKTFQVSAEVVNIYGNGEDVINTTYKAENKEKALQGFIDYLKSNRNLKTFSNVQIKG
ncbi:hypothetical protein VPIG_00060 [Vibrio phage PWH3a-P1]|uniref:hypothetical protein n=1 Tax=Vibrio phage PWH3a-P1 TaxID=754058 RepID=UPI0002C0B3C4|nr:hypothetical protein VPIG_00060 [Vibrio phage PWH3a-P1]AGH31918.1 hypothetical protein VPIG_00060 [Vibrio phage PWH3a-P1]